jgi:hypothetical protein
VQPTTETTLSLARKRFDLIVSIVGDVQGKVILTAFYFTVLVPFGLGSRLLADPLRRKAGIQGWQHRDPVPTDLESAQQQG